MKGCKSVLRQIDWTKVATSVLEIETSTIHPTSYGEILQTQIQESLAETCRKSYFEQRDDESDQESEEGEETDDADAGTESGEDESDEESYEHSFVDSDGNKEGSVEYKDSDDSVDAGEVEDNVDNRTNVCAICRNRIAYNIAETLWSDISHKRDYMHIKSIRNCYHTLVQSIRRLG